MNKDNVGDALPPLPSDKLATTYTADQMRDYARAAIASRPAPVAEQKPVIGARAWFHRGMVNFDVEDVLAALDDGKGTPIDLYIGAAPAAVQGEVVVTWDEARTRIVAVTRQDEEGRVLSVIAHAAPAAPSAAQAAGVDVRNALQRAFSLGETHWRQSNSEYRSQNKKADETYDKFQKLVEDTCAALATTPSEGVAAPVVTEEGRVGDRELVETIAYALTAYKKQVPFDKIFTVIPTDANGYAAAYVAKALQHVAAAPAQPSAEQVRDAALVAEVRAHLIGVVRSFGEKACADYIETWHQPDRIIAAIQQSQQQGGA